MSALELRFSAISRSPADGERVELPPSRKTRALLAYLALTGAPFAASIFASCSGRFPTTRAARCVGACRSCAGSSTTRRRARIVADRLVVRFDATDVAIDVAALAGDCATGSSTRRRSRSSKTAAARYCGTPLEGLELPTFHDYSAWYMGERERATRAPSAPAECAAEAPRRRTAARRRARSHARADRAVRREGARRADSLADGARPPRPGRAALPDGLAPAEGGRRHADRRAVPRLARRPGAHPRRTDRAARASPARAAKPHTGASPAHARCSSSPASRACSAATPSSSVRRRSRGDDRAAPLPRRAAARRARHRQEPPARSRPPSPAKRAPSCSRRRPTKPIDPAVRAVRSTRCASSSPRAATAVFDRGDSGNRDRLFERLAELIAERARRQPVVLRFDDLQWSDESSAAALHYVIRTSADLSVARLARGAPRRAARQHAVMRALRELRHAGRSRSSASRRSARTPCARSSALARRRPTPRASARNAAAIRCSRSSSLVPKRPARAANRCARSFRNASRASKPTAARCCVGPPCSRRASTRRRSHGSRGSIGMRSARRSKPQRATRCWCRPTAACAFRTS